MHINDYLRFLPAAYQSFSAFKSDFESQIDSAKDIVVANNKFRGPGPSRRRFTETVVNFFDSRFGILSLTQDPKNFLTWSHYADEHRDLVIEFDTDSDFFKGKGNGIGEPREVTYSDERPEVYWEPSGLTDEEMERHYVDNFLVTKSKQWRYEEEWRVIKRLDDSDETRQVDCGPSVPIELFEFPPEAISRIIFGVRTPKAKKEEVKGLTSKPPFEHVNVSESRIHKKEYKIVIDW